MSELKMESVAVGCTPIDLWVNLHLLVFIKD